MCVCVFVHPSVPPLPPSLPPSIYPPIHPCLHIQILRIHASMRLVGWTSSRLLKLAEFRLSPGLEHQAQLVQDYDTESK